MRIAICDDEASCLADVSAIAEEYKRERTQKSVSLHTFSHPEDLLEAAERVGGFDVYVLDVIMPSMTGIELGMRLRDNGYDGKILYLTSSPEYSLDAFRVKAFDYIVKPIRRDAFFRAVDEASAAIAEKKGKHLIVKTKEKSVKIAFDHILYAEFHKRAVCYYLAGGRTVESLTVRGTFSEAVADLLADRRFFAAGQSMVVNLDHVSEVESCAVVFGTTYRPFLGEKLCRKLRDAWSEYLFAEEG